MEGTLQLTSAHFAENQLENIIEIEDDESTHEDQSMDWRRRSLFYKRKRDDHPYPFKPWVWEDEMAPHEIVVALQRRSSILNKLQAVETLVAKVVGKRSLARMIVGFLAAPVVFSRGHLRRLRVAPNQVFLTLRRWFHRYGRVPVPRNLRQLVLVHRKPLVEVKKEYANKDLSPASGRWDWADRRVDPDLR
jgi:hypothetical protein